MNDHPKNEDAELPPLEPRHLWSATEAFHIVKKLVVLVVGLTLLLAGVVMIVLPGPAIVVIPVALAILGTEFIWAKSLLRKFKAQAEWFKEFVPGMRKHDKK